VEAILVYFIYYLLHVIRSEDIVVADVLAIKDLEWLEALVVCMARCEVVNKVEWNHV
jgi:hypothetical protein